MQARRFCVISFLALVVVLGLVAVPAEAQQPQYPYEVDTKPSRGIMPNSEQLSGPLDNIDPVSGKLHIQIPLASLPAGHAGSGFDLGLTYDSHIYDLAASDLSDERLTQIITPTLSSGGWHYNFGNYGIEEERRFLPYWEQECAVGDQQYDLEHERIYRYRISLPDGSQHILHLLGYGDEKNDGYWGDGFYAVDMSGARSYCATQRPSRYPGNASGTLTYYTTDGSYLRLQIPATGSSWWNQQWTLFYPDGRRVLGRFNQAEHLYDANGNGVHITYQTENTHTVAYIADDFGRKIRLEFGLTSSTTEREDKITVAGRNGLLEWRVKWQRMVLGGPGASYVCHEDERVTPIQLSHCPFNIHAWVVKYIQLPLAGPSFEPPNVKPWTSFEFTYPTGVTYGFLSSMRVPSGAVYSYCCRPYNSANFASTIALEGYTTRTVTHDGVSEVWTYSRIPGSSTVTAPDGGQTIYRSYDPYIASEFWKRGLVYWISEPGGTIRKRQWARNKAFGLAAARNVDPNNAFVERESVTVDAVAGLPRSAVADFAIDKNGNSLSSKEYGWSNTLAAEATMESPGELLRETETFYAVVVPASGIVSNPTNVYWNPSAPLRLNAVVRRAVKDGSAVIKGVTEFTYDDPLSKGNVRFERRWDDAKLGCTPSMPLAAACPAQHREYDEFGNLVDIFEPAIRTQITYANGPYPSKVEYGTSSPSYRSFVYNWDTATGTLNLLTDEQNGTTTTYGYDAFGRQSLVAEAGQRNTRTEYFDEQRTVRIKTDLRTLDDGALQTVTHVDQLGRADLVRTSDGAPLSLLGTDGINVETRHATFTGGTRAAVSSPYRSTDDLLRREWACTQKDQAGRVVAAAAFKGGTPPADCLSGTNRTGVATTDYHAAAGSPRTRAMDPAGRSIDRYADSLGRLITVVEDPLGSAYVTDYKYDVLGNLTETRQADGASTQVRSFVYTSLGRLKTAINPETGTLQYTYNDAGDLLTRSDGRGFLTAVDYDDLHRVTAKVYVNDGDVTPDVTYTYHAVAPCAGQLQSFVSTAATISYDTCDAMGRVLTHRQNLTGSGGGSYPFSYTYWLNGSLKSMQYPSGKVVNVDVDNAGRTAKIYSAAKTFADMTTLSSPPYRADGRLEKLKFGNGLWETRDFRAPGDPTVLKLGSSEGADDLLELKYNYAPTTNNGNLLSHVIRRGTAAWSQTYDYDALNRLTCATETTGAIPAGSCSPPNSWGQAFGYDRFGNRWVSASIGLPEDVHQFGTGDFIDGNTNRIKYVSYDAAGNLESYSPRSMAYDAENRMISLTSSANGSSFFTYDGVGRRIKKATNISGGTPTFYIYDAAGRLAAEYSTTPAPSGTSYPFADLLGTPRAITSATGAITECSDYSPFGRLLQTPTRSLPCHQIPSRSSQQFTSQVRDQETQLDYFGARYYSAAQGRFLSPDAPFADQHVENPQSWNLYSYTRNNPLMSVDLDGRQTAQLRVPALPEDKPNEHFKSTLLGSVKGIGLAAVDFGRFLGMPDETASPIENWLRYSNKREESVGNLVQFYQTVAGVKAAASAGTSIAKSPRAIRSLVKIAQGTRRDVRQITVLGSSRDVARYAGRSGFNVLNMDDLPMSEWSRRNAQWLNEAITRGDEIWLLTDPVAHAKLMQQLGKESYYLDLELPMLKQYTGVKVLEKYATSPR